MLTEEVTIVLLGVDKFGPLTVGGSRVRSINRLDDQMKNAERCSIEVAEHF